MGDVVDYRSATSPVRPDRSGVVLKCAFIGGGAFALLLLLAVVFFETDEGIARDNIERGDGIVAALERYKTDAGWYPLTLDDLVPKHIGRLPQARNAEWMYFGGGSEFTLYFQGHGRNPIGRYDSTQKRWSVDTK